MKALREIGLKKAFRFGCLTVLLLFYKLMIFPQLRVLYLRLLGVRIGKNVVVHSTAFFNYYHRGFSALKIGDSCFIGDGALLDLAHEIVMFDNVTIAERVTLLTHTNVGYRDHPLQSHFPPVVKPVVLEQGAFVGASATILPGVTIGECAFVAAGSVVTKDVPPRTLVGGVPARVIRQIGNET